MHRPFSFPVATFTFSVLRCTERSLMHETLVLGMQDDALRGHARGLLWRKFHVSQLAQQSINIRTPH